MVRADGWVGQVGQESRSGRFDLVCSINLRQKTSISPTFLELLMHSDQISRWGNMGEAVVRHEPGKYSQVARSISISIMESFRCVCVCVLKLTRLPIFSKKLNSAIDKSL